MPVTRVSDPHHRAPLLWRPATVVDAWWEAAHTRSLRLAVPGWAGHVAGQHVDVRVTDREGRRIVRRCAVSSAPTLGGFELTVELVPGDEVSSYVVSLARRGHVVEVRGPSGRALTWTPAAACAPVLLVGERRGLVPLMSIVRAVGAAGWPVPVRLVHTVPTPDDVIYRRELRRLEASGAVAVERIYSERAPASSPQPPRELSLDDLADPRWSPERGTTCYVCGSDAFVAMATALLREAGHRTRAIHTERFADLSDAQHAMAC